MMRSCLLLASALFLAAGCGGPPPGNKGDDADKPTDEPTDTTDASDPMVGDWRATRFISDGEVYDMPLVEAGETTELEFSFTDEPRGLCTWRYTDADGVESADTFEFVIDVFTEGRWLLEIRNASSDMILDCTAEDDTLSCDGSCDGLSGCGMDLVPIE